ncbi:MAG: XdhC family protein [Flavobacteriaceae bacterium]
MTHELKRIIQAYSLAQKNGLKTVLATVVALDGSSYRRPGVRMLIREDGKMTGAVSGGCVEKEICRQADSVFDNEIPKTMTYDGRYRLGCEGILYILIEPFAPNDSFLQAFSRQLKNRDSFRIVSYFERIDKADTSFGSLFFMGKEALAPRPVFNKNVGLEIFEQLLAPCFKLVVLGAEHDAVQLCSYAALTGWEVTVVSGLAEEKVLADFPGIQKLIPTEPESFCVDAIDAHTAVVIMTHSYVKDLQYLIRLRDSRPAYLGLLGPSKRREKLLGELLERYPDVAYDFFEGIHGPAGLNIGGETAQEIAIAILSEVLSVVRNQAPMMLKNKQGAIHS